MLSNTVPHYAEVRGRAKSMARRSPHPRGGFYRERFYIWSTQTEDKYHAASVFSSLNILFFFFGAAAGRSERAGGATEVAAVV